MEFAVVVGSFIKDVVSKSEMFDNLPSFVIFILLSSTPSNPFSTKLFMDGPSGYKTKSSNRVWTLLAVVFVVLSDNFVSTQAITHKKRPRCYFRDFFFYVGMRTFSMVLLPVNLDHGGIGTFKGLGFRDLLLGPVNFRDPSSLCLREFLKFLISKYIKRFRQKKFGTRKGITMQGRN